MLPFIRFALAGAPTSLLAAKALAAEISKVAASQPSADKLQPQIATLTALASSAKTLTAACEGIAQVLADVGVANAVLAKHWPKWVLASEPAVPAGSAPLSSQRIEDHELSCMPAPVADAVKKARDQDELRQRSEARHAELDEQRQRVLAKAPPAVSKAFSEATMAMLSEVREPAELHALLVPLDPGDKGYMPPVAALSANLFAVAPAPARELSPGERALAESAALRERVNAEKAARFSRNHGAERDARRLALLAQYTAMPAGPERVAFLSANSSDLFAAANQLARTK